MIDIDEKLLRDLPEPDAAIRFLDRLAESSPSRCAGLQKNNALLSDVLTLVTFSPLLAATLLQNPEYFTWLDRKRRDPGVCSKEDLLESLARFSLTNSTLEPQVLFARFRRRELLRIYLRDIRRLATIAEITEDISNLADATLEYALRLARSEMDGRFGQPQEMDPKGRPVGSRFCVVALGKLGSRELNYSSDIDLIFIYSGEGTTSGAGSRGSVSNREYFVKLAEHLTKLIGQPTGEGAAYRVDLRLRPHGTLGPLAQSVDDMVRYYETEARPWERQVMIRSRGCAGDSDLFRALFGRIEHRIFSKDQTVDDALANVRESKRKIDLEQVARKGFDVKLGRGGIREIEFIAQAFQLAHGGRDEWLRAPHTLISLDRLRDRGYLTDAELSQLAAAYDFLRRTEHILQMEEGVQTHLVPEDCGKRLVVANRVRFATSDDLEKSLPLHTSNVHRIFERVFGADRDNNAGNERIEPLASPRSPTAPKSVLVDRLATVSPHFASIVTANPRLNDCLIESGGEIDSRYVQRLSSGIERAGSFRDRITALRQIWSRLLLEIVAADVFGSITIFEAKRLQTTLAEASIDAAVDIVRSELGLRYSSAIEELPLAILALGKLGGRGVDYDSDLDLVLVYDEGAAISPGNISPAEFFGRAAELFVTTLSSMTRDGHLYRVDLRLRPYGTKGLSAMASDAFLGYMRHTAAAWEMLAFVKLRAVAGDMHLGGSVEREAREIIHERARSMDHDELRRETLRVRQALEEQRSRVRRSEVDIKYGAGGMLDVYFATRYLQLKNNVPDGDADRSTPFTLQLLADRGALPNELFAAFSQGYTFLSSLDHNIRLTVGRSTKVPAGNEPVMKTIAARMDAGSPSDLLETLTIQRLAIRDAFESIMEMTGT